MVVSSSELLRRNITQAAIQFKALEDLATPLEKAAAMVLKSLVSGNQLFTCGNGGSAADAAHIATEFVCRYQNDRRPYPAICFTDAGSTLSAIGNDYDFNQIFARQVHAFGREGDVLIVITTSGNSMNIKAALEAANERGIQSIALLGRDGGQCVGLATVELNVGGQVTARIQEAHHLLYHALCELVEQELPRD